MKSNNNKEKLLTRYLHVLSYATIMTIEEREISIVGSGILFLCVYFQVNLINNSSGFVDDFICCALIES